MLACCRIVAPDKKCRLKRTLFQTAFFYKAFIHGLGKRYDRIIKLMNIFLASRVMITKFKIL